VPALNVLGNVNNDQLESLIKRKHFFSQALKPAAVLSTVSQYQATGDHVMKSLPSFR